MADALISIKLKGLNAADLHLLLQLARVSFERSRERGGYVVGGQLFEFRSAAQLDELIDAALAERTRRSRRTGAA